MISSFPAADRSLRSARRHPARGRRRWVLGFALALLCGGPDAFGVEFFGPATLPQDGDALSVLGVRLPGRDQDEFVTGNGAGFLNLNRYNPTSESFTLLHRFFVGGRVEAIVPWLGRPASAPGVVAAVADPDRLVFVEIQSTAPQLRIAAEVALDEDPGALGFVGDITAETREVAVTLPGMDRVAIVRGAATAWALVQTVDCGDDPTGAASVDLDGDGSNEFVLAQTGPLAGNLGVLRRQIDGTYSFGSLPLAGVVPDFVAASDIDTDGRDELLVARSEPPAVLVCAAVGGALVVEETVPLSVPSGDLVAGLLPDGAMGLISANGERGLVEYAARQAGSWVRRDILYPGCRAVGLALADVDGDLRPDLLAAGGVSQVATLMLGTATGQFAGIRALSLSASPGAFSFADVDADGHADLVVADSNASTVRVFAGDAAGGLELEARVWDVGFVTGPLTCLQLDGDPDLELAILDVIGNRVVVYDLDLVTGPTPVSSTPTATFPFFLGSADMDDDGALDLLVVTQATPDVTVLFGDGAGAFPSATSFAFDRSVDWLVALDLDADGLPDLAGTDGTSRVWTRLNDGARGFGDERFVNAGLGAFAMDTGDLDGDGDDDLVVANRSESSLSFFENDGSGGLVRRIGAHSLPSRPAGVVLRDFDQDGRPDALANLASAGTLALVFASGAWQFAQPAEIQGGPQMVDVDAPDLNGDGAPDILTLDRSLLLSLSLINVDPDIVAVAPTAVAAACNGEGWEIRIRPDRPGPWELELGRGSAWRPLMANGRAQAGTVAWDGEGWVLDLPLGVAAAWLPGAGGDWRVRLSAGADGDRESAVWNLPSDCLAADGRLPARLAWEARPWPNPFNPAVQARFRLGQAGEVEAVVYDLAGRRVATLLRGELAAGDHGVRWNGDGPEGPAAAGLYLLRIATPGAVLRHKLILVK